MTMKFGICVPNYGKACSKKSLDAVCDLAENSDGYSSLWATDHLMVPKGREYSELYGTILEPTAVLAYLAARTRESVLGTSVLLLPLRNPILVAKTLVSIDILSEGRLVAGLGVGWCEEEFRNLGADFRTRGRYMDEGIGVIRALWRDDPPESYVGTFSKFNGLFGPKPHRRGGPPILIGGNSEAAIKRAANLGDGWHPVGLGPERFASGAAKIRSLAKKDMILTLRNQVEISDREPGSYLSPTGERREPIAGTRNLVVDMLEKYRRAGLEHLICFFGDLDHRGLLRKIRNFQTEVIPSFAG